MPCKAASCLQLGPDALMVTADADAAIGVVFLTTVAALGEEAGNGLALRLSLFLTPTTLPLLLFVIGIAFASLVVVLP